MKDKCLICDNLFDKTQYLKYKCTRCTQIICNNCYTMYIKTNTNCMFCRGDLYNIDISIVSYPHEERTNTIVYRKPTLCWITTFLFCMFFLQAALISSSIRYTPFNIDNTTTSAPTED